MKRILIATSNAGKKRELAECLRDLPLEIVTLADFPALAPCMENGRTFMENARQKGRYYHAQTGLFTLADDSGLEVDALSGQPGVFSARFAGEGATDAERIRKLLHLTADIPPHRRTARFVCALSAFDAAREIFTVQATCAGRIAEAPRGEYGFGFDPIFIVPELGKTFAELPPAEKHQRSHRGQALTAARVEIRNYLDKLARNDLE